MTPGKISTARFLIGWSREELARACKVSASDIANYEAGQILSNRSLKAIRIALLGRGIEFTVDGPVLRPSNKAQDLSAQQCQTARRLLGWAQRCLANSAGLNKSVITTFEASGHVPCGREDTRNERLGAIRGALEAAGVEFTDGDAPGVKLRLQSSER